MSSTNDQRSTGVLNFADDELITQVDISSGQFLTINYLKIVTTDSKGSIKTYGPFGLGYGNVTSVHGFYGHSSSDYTFKLSVSTSDLAVHTTIIFKVFVQSCISFRQLDKVVKHFVILIMVFMCISKLTNNSLS